jgi:hypothetical protein
MNKLTDPGFPDQEEVVAGAAELEYADKLAQSAGVSSTIHFLERAQKIYDDGNKTIVFYCVGLCA